MCLRGASQISCGQTIYEGVHLCESRGVEAAVYTSNRGRLQSGG